jgi:hypothetical protein
MRLQTLQREREMRAALVVGHGVDFVHDHGFDIAQDGAASFRRQQDVERFGSRNQNMRRPLQHGAALVHQGVAGANRGANLRHQQAAVTRHLKNLPQRSFKIFLDVVAQRLERGDVKDFGAVAQIASQGFADQPVNAGQKRSQCLPGPGGRGDKRRSTRQNVGPSLLLGLGGRPESLDKPFLHQRMCPGEGGGNWHGQHSSIPAFAKCSLFGGGFCGA